MLNPVYTSLRKAGNTEGLEQLDDAIFELVQILFRTQQLHMATHDVVEFIHRVQEEQARTGAVIAPGNKEFQKGWDARLWDIFGCLPMKSRVWLLRQINEHHRRKKLLGKGGE